MNLIQQLAEYQNAPIPTLEAAKKGANPAVSPWVAGAILSDRIEKQKRMAMQQGAAEGEQPTVDEQQDQEVAGIMQALTQQGAGQAQAAMQAEPVRAAEGGLMQAKMDPGMFDFCGGGIIAFGKGGDVEDDTIYDPVTGVPIAGASTREGEDMTLREALGLGNVENRRALERAEAGQRQASAPKREAPKENEIERLNREILAGGAGRGITAAQARARDAGAKPAAPAGGAGAPAAGKGVLGLLTNSPEWKAMEAARTKQFEAPEMAQTPGALAAEREAYLKAQGITSRPWETAAKQTADLRRLLGEEDATRKREQADRERDERYDTFVANLGAGSFGQSAQGGLRANIKRREEMRAEEQRIKELRYNQNLKLNEIDAKAEELRYNEANGDVAAAQKNRQELAKLKRDYEKDQATIANQQAGLRERAAAADLTAETQLKTAGMRAGASSALTPKQIADIRDKAYDNINNKVKAGGVPLQLAMKKDPQMFERMVQQETERLLAAYTGGAAPAPVQSQYGPPPQGAVRLKK